MIKTVGVENKSIFARGEGYTEGFSIRKRVFW